MALHHAGVFGDADALLREQHLAYVLRALSDADIWHARVRDVVDWWCQREMLGLAVTGSAVTLRNPNRVPITGVRVVRESRDGVVVRPLPTLPAGGSFTLDLACADGAAPAARRATCA